MKGKSRQREAIEVVLEHVKKDLAVKAVFLKGASAYGEEDEYSDVDFYCLVKIDELDNFLKRRLDLLQSYMEIVYYSEVNFVGPQIVAVFANGLHFDLYTVTEKNFPCKGDFVPLYDPEELLVKYQKEVQGFELTIEELEEIFHEFSFTLVEIEAALGRRQMLFAARLVSHLSGYASVLLRQMYDPKRAKLGLKKLELYIPEKLKEKYYLTLNVNTPETALKSVLALVDIVEDIVRQLEERYSLQLNWRFFQMMKARLKQMQKTLPLE